ncbi:MAG: hypothetical protein HZC28_19280 [Spirochaetes bacterium]|nr:hypothetical protein [Spirochaetota bacterium]
MRNTLVLIALSMSTVFAAKFETGAAIVGLGMSRSSYEITQIFGTNAATVERNTMNYLPEVFGYFVSPRVFGRMDSSLYGICWKSYDDTNTPTVTNNRYYYTHDNLFILLPNIQGGIMFPIFDYFSVGAGVYFADVLINPEIGNQLLDRFTPALQARAALFLPLPDWFTVCITGGAYIGASMINLDKIGSFYMFEGAVLVNLGWFGFFVSVESEHLENIIQSSSGSETKRLDAMSIKFAIGMHPLAK